MYQQFALMFIKLGLKNPKTKRMPSLPPSSAVQSSSSQPPPFQDIHFLSRQLAIVEQDEDSFVLVFLPLPQHILYIAQLPE